jgi:hypothetical protein
MEQYGILLNKIESNSMKFNSILEDRTGAVDEKCEG